MRRVLVFTQPGCDACEAFLPRISRLSAPFRAQGLPVFNVDTSKRQGADLANKLQVDQTPTTVIIDEKDRVWRRMLGAETDEATRTLLDLALRTINV